MKAPLEREGHLNASRSPAHHHYLKRGIQAVLAGLHGWDPETCDVDRFQALMDAPSTASWGDGSVTLAPDDVRFAISNPPVLSVPPESR